MTRQKVIVRSDVRIGNARLPDGYYGVVVIDHHAGDHTPVSMIGAPHAQYDDAVRALSKAIMAHSDGMSRHGYSVDLVHNVNGALDTPSWSFVSAAG